MGLCACLITFPTPSFCQHRCITNKQRGFLIILSVFTRIKTDYFVNVFSQVLQLGLLVQSDVLRHPRAVQAGGGGPGYHLWKWQGPKLYTLPVKTSRFHIIHSWSSITRALKFGVVGVAVQFPVGKVAGIVSQLSELSEQSAPHQTNPNIPSTTSSVQ